MAIFNLGMESIKRQNNDFFDALILGVSKLRKSGDFSTNGVKKCFISQTIKEYTGINAPLRVVQGWAAFTHTPTLVMNHVFDYQPYNTSASDIIDVTKTQIKGAVDSNNSKVSGVFSDIKSDITIGTALFAPNELTDRQIAGIILHEVGHIFTYYQFISTIGYGNLVIQQTIRNIFLTDDYKTKQIHLKQADVALGIDTKPDNTNWVDTSKDNLEVILVSRFYRHLQTRSDSVYYDVRNCEQLADIFAVKHGAAVDLAQANHILDKRYKLYGDRNLFVHVLTQSAALLKQITFGKSSISEILLTMDQPKQYDDPKDRIAFLKFQLIDDLKQLPRGDNASRKDIVESIKDIDNILKTIHVRRDVLTFIHQTMTSVGKSATKHEASQKKLEEMLYNNLYYQSAKLKTLH